MLDDLARHSSDIGALRDRLPYVLDLLSGVTRTIHAESRGRRTPPFTAWWNSVDRSAQRAIQEMRNAELKELVSRTVADIHVEINVRAADYPGRLWRCPHQLCPTRPGPRSVRRSWRGRPD
jgi:hypothetical protein